METKVRASYSTNMRLRRYQLIDQIRGFDPDNYLEYTQEILQLNCLQI